MFGRLAILLLALSVGGLQVLLFPAQVGAQSEDAGIAEEAGETPDPDDGEAPGAEDPSVEDPAESDPDGVDPEVDDAQVEDAHVEDPEVEPPLIEIFAEPVDPWADTNVDTAEGGESAPEDARGWDVEPGVEPEDVALFLPRAILFVPKLVLSAVFWPITELLTIFSRHAVLPHVERVLYWNDDHTAGWSPVISYRSGVGLTFGANVFHDDLFGHDESLSVGARYGGRFTQGYELSFEAERFAGTRLWLEVLARYEVNPGQLFSGLGMPTSQGGIIVLPQDPRGGDFETFYEQERILGLLRIGYTHGTVGSILKAGLGAIFNRREFGPNDTGEAQTADYYDTGQIVGFDAGATVLELQANLIADTRDGRGLRATGAYFELFGGYVPPLNDHSYFHYGTELSYAFALFGGDRILSVRAALESVHAEDEEIPFTDLPRLGGADRLRGFQEDRFRDRHTALASVEYRYPIHANLQGALFVDAGRVAPDYGELFGELDAWEVGFGGGLRLGGEESVAVRFDLAYGDGLQFFFSTDVARAFDGRTTEL